MIHKKKMFSSVYQKCNQFVGLYIYVLLFTIFRWKKIMAVWMLFKLLTKRLLLFNINDEQAKGVDLEKQNGIIIYTIKLSNHLTNNERKSKCGTRVVPKHI